MEKIKVTKTDNDNYIISGAELIRLRSILTPDILKNAKYFKTNLFEIYGWIINPKYKQVYITKNILKKLNEIWKKSRRQK